MPDRQPLDERTRTLMEVITLSQREAEAFAPVEGDVCISIRSHGATLPALHADWRDVLYLRFNDVQCECQECPRTLGLSRPVAQQIAEFVLRHHESATRIVVHCFVGVSRSVSVAAAIRAWLGLPGTRDMILNPLAFNRVMEAFHLEAARLEEVPDA